MKCVVQDGKADGVQIFNHDTPKKYLE